jgi:serine/threonine-protein kinase
MEAGAGNQIGHYEIKDLLGEGGMGSVYLGVDTRTGEPVAVKEIKSDLAGSDQEAIIYEPS